MNAWNIEKYWAEKQSWIDKDLDKTYEKLSPVMFNPERKSPYWKDEDLYETLVTDLSAIDQYQEGEWKSSDWSETQYVLTPRKLHEPTIEDPQNTRIVLDTEFMELHPRSDKRIQFVVDYADRLGIKVVHWSYEEIVSEMLNADIDVYSDERFDPFYREAYKRFAAYDNFHWIPYPFVREDNRGEPVPKFFRYWNKATKKSSLFDESQYPYYQWKLV